MAVEISASEHDRQALAAEFRGCGDTDPAAIGKSLVGVFESTRGSDTAIRVATAAFLIASAVERREGRFAEFRGLGEDRLDDIGSRFGKAR